jgi:hypothetical protein
MTSDINGTVEAIQGVAISSTTPITNQVLEFNGTEWVPTALPSSLPPNGSAGGDLDGTYPDPSVIALQGNAISSSTPATGDLLVWNGSAWTPTVPAASFTSIHGYQYFENHSITINSAWDQVTFTNTGPSSNTSYSSNNIVVSVAGTVKVSGTMNDYNGNVLILAIYQNGSLVGGSTGNSTSTIGGQHVTTVEVIANCSANDTFALYMYTGSTGTYTFAGASMTLVAC